jgi:hypothetical protein
LARPGHYGREAELSLRFAWVFLSTTAEIQTDLLLSVARAVAAVPVETAAMTGSLEDAAAFWSLRRVSRKDVRFRQTISARYDIARYDQANKRLTARRFAPILFLDCPRKIRRRKTREGAREGKQRISR